MHPPRAILFDMDGVLVKSEEAWFYVVEAAGARFRGRPITREEFFPTFGQGTAADVPTFGLSCTVAELDAFYASHFGKYREHVWVNPHAARLLDGIRAAGLGVAVVTNTVTALAREILEAAHLTASVPVLCCADEVPHAKPAPDLVLHAAKRLGVSPQESWMIGDSRFDRGAAEAAGAHFVGLGIDGADRLERLEDLSALLGRQGLTIPNVSR